MAAGVFLAAIPVTGLIGAGSDGAGGETAAGVELRAEETTVATTLKPSPLMSHKTAPATASNAMVWRTILRVLSGSGFSSMDMDP